MKEIPLTQGKVALVSDHRFEELSQYRWYTAKRDHAFYAMRSQGYDKVLMHRQIMNAPQGVTVDHKDLNGLNNTDENLRLASQSQQGCNTSVRRDSTSGYKGVSWCKRYHKWRAYVTVNGSTHHLGYFVNLEDAVAARDTAALKYHAEFARTNAQLRGAA